MMRQNDAKCSYSKVVLRKRQTADSGSAFSYKSGSSPLHRCPAWIKILVLPVVSIVVFELSPVCAAALLLAQVIIASCLRFTVCEQLSDLRAVFYYAAMLLFVKCISFTAEYFVAMNAAVGAEAMAAADTPTHTFASSGLLETAFMLLRLLCVMQTASLVFKTSTSLQLREGLETIELAVRNVFRVRRNPRNKTESSACGESVAPCGAPSVSAKNSAPVAGVIALFVCFIPQVSKNWQQVKRAWKARGGKNSIRMYIVLLPVLFSVGMKQAYTTARAISIRKR